MLSIFAVLFLVTAQQAAQPEPAPAWGLPLHGEEAERFLRTAKIVSITNFKTNAITHPKKVELTDGEQTHYALFKTIDEFDLVKHLRGGNTELRFSDSFKYEIADRRVAELGEEAARTSRCRVQGSGFRVQGSGFRVQGSGFSKNNNSSRRVFKCTLCPVP